MQAWKLAKLKQYYQTQLYEAAGDDKKINKRQIAKLYGISAQNLNNYIKRKNWNDLTEFVYVPLDIKPGIKKNEPLNGSKSKLTGEMLEQLFEYARRTEDDGKPTFTNQEIAEKLGISVSTFYKYHQENIHFYKTLRSARRLGQVEDAMLKSATGYKYVESKVEDIVVGKTGEKTGEIKSTKIIKEVTPDVRAQKYLMSNIVPEEYTENKKVEQKITISEDIDVSQLTDEQLEKLMKDIENGDKE
ncbi:hypothetical protein EII29_09785 [Leptotrichia sp. OH3620_COT-345]|uniref:hypothetical protein n=1 Tax=Leptotrichia sp. OH3620_COT-345 TaxID=2491048 RepID=UPI000F64E717|nr:hypothetical protein [Leptotrichia sp. OH3620_COT-345]RRD38806.1 hypothetical protein EII29_09785 [Leptotrichia sp. OH3620_COT-345]